MGTNNELDNLNINVDGLFTMDYHKAVEEAKNSSNKKPDDPTFWKFNKDMANTYIFRFIPDAHTHLTYVEVKYHGINHFPNGKKSFLGGHCKNMVEAWSCPACAYGSKLWKTGNKSKQEDAKMWFAKNKWVSNILMINDPVTPDNNGKVFKFEFGIQVLEKILKRNSPEASEINDPQFKQYSPFDPVKGGNFIFKVKLKKFEKNNKETSQPNYEESYFDNNITPISASKEEMVDILKRTYNLQDYIKKLDYLEPERINAEVGYLMDDADATSVESYNPPTSPNSSSTPSVSTIDTKTAEQPKSTVVNTEKAINPTEADFINSL